jgi:hypothetical protein
MMNVHGRNPFFYIPIPNHHFTAGATDLNNKMSSFPLPVTDSITAPDKPTLYQRIQQLNGTAYLYCRCWVEVLCNNTLVSSVLSNVTQHQ